MNNCVPRLQKDTQFRIFGILTALYSDKISHLKILGAASVRLSCWCKSVTVSFLELSLLLNSFIFIVIITACLTWIKLLLATSRVKNGKVSVLEEGAEIFQDGDLFWKAIISFLWQSQCAFSCLSILCASYVSLCI